MCGSCGIGHIYTILLRDSQHTRYNIKYRSHSRDVLCCVLVHVCARIIKALGLLFDVSSNPISQHEKNQHTRRSLIVRCLVLCKSKYTKRVFNGWLRGYIFTIRERSMTLTIVSAMWRECICNNGQGTIKRLRGSSREGGVCVFSLSFCIPITNIAM